MKQEKRQRLEAAGWKIGTASEFLQLTPEEETFIALRLALSQGIRKRRQEQGLSQQKLAKILGSSQSRVAKIEAGEPSVSLDLIVRSLLALGTSLDELSELIATARYT